MKGRKRSCAEAVHQFKKNHPALFRQPIIQSFLREKNHRLLVKQAICFPMEKNMRLVDEAFQAFYEDVKVFTYLSNLIYYNAINFDKGKKKHFHRETLTLDQPLKEDQEITQKDMLADTPSDIAANMVHETITDYVEKPKLYEALQTLTPKQQKILTYKYAYGQKNKEIAEQLSVSPQNISKIHRQSLQV